MYLQLQATATRTFSCEREAVQLGADDAVLVLPPVLVVVIVVRVLVHVNARALVRATALDVEQQAVHTTPDLKETNRPETTKNSRLSSFQPVVQIQLRCTIFTCTCTEIASRELLLHVYFCTTPRCKIYVFDM